MTGFEGPSSPAVGDILSTRCVGCGSQVAYAPGSAQLQCGACGHRTEITHGADETIDEHSFDTWLASNPKATVASLGGQVLTCQGCGALTESTALSGSCQFCGGHLVAVTNPEGLIQPEAVLPFVVEAQAARLAVSKWSSSRWFAPTALKSVADTESLQGTYVPYWTFDAVTTSPYKGERGEHYTVKVNDREERRTKWHAASGVINRTFDDITVPASTNLPKAKLTKLGPWQLQKAVPYRPEYLAGHSTLRYDVEPADGAETAKAEMATVIRNEVKREIGGDDQKIHQVRTTYSSVMFKLVLLPIWIATYMYAGKQWQVMVNANTGEVLGQRPYSPVKIIIAIVVAVLVLVVGILVWRMRT